MTDADSWGPTPRCLQAFINSDVLGARPFSGPPCCQYRALSLSHETIKEEEDGEEGLGRATGSATGNSGAGGPATGRQAEGRHGEMPLALQHALLNSCP
jgi:hypothetical protein